MSENVTWMTPILRISYKYFYLPTQTNMKTIELLRNRFSDFLLFTHICANRYPVSPAVINNGKLDQNNMRIRINHTNKHEQINKPKHNVETIWLFRRDGRDAQGTKLIQRCIIGVRVGEEGQLDGKARWNGKTVCPTAVIHSRNPLLIACQLKANNDEAAFEKLDQQVNCGKYVTYNAINCTIIIMICRDWNAIW